MKLKQEVTYESHDPQHEYRYDKHLIARKQFGNVLRWSRKVYRGYLDLPSIPPTSSKSTCPITVNYSIKIIVNPTEFHWKMKVKIPLTIGSVPIMDDNMQSIGLLRVNRDRNLMHNNNDSLGVVQQMNLMSLEEEQQMRLAENQNQPTLLVTDVDNPPDYVAMSEFSINIKFHMTNVYFFFSMQCLPLMRMPWR